MKPAPARALTEIYLRDWLASRGPFLWLAFVAVWAVFDYQSASGQPGGAAGILTLAAIAGFLAGYDTTSRLRETGSIRLMLLHPPPRWLFSAAWLTAGAVLVAGVLALFSLYRIAVGADVVATLGAATFAVLGALGFVAFAQVAALVLPRDTAAVGGLLLVFWGFHPAGRWLPTAIPRWLAGAAEALHHVIPTTYRLELAYGGSASALLIVLLQPVVAVLVAAWLLSRPRLRARRPDR